VKPYEPQLIYYPDGDVAEYLLRDCAVVYSEVAPGVALVRDMDSREVVGFRIQSPQAWVAALTGPARDGGDQGREQDDISRCIACDEPLKDGDLVHSEASGGLIHAACCGPEPESYYGPDGEPLKPGDPIPKPWVYKDEPLDAFGAHVVDGVLGKIGDREIGPGHVVLSEERYRWLLRRAAPSTPDHPPTGSPSPAIADEHDLAALNARATPGKAVFEIVRCPYPECDDDDLPGALRIGSVEVAHVYEKYGPNVDARYEDDGALIAALINAYRSGRLARASDAEHYMRLATDRAERIHELEQALATAQAAPDGTAADRVCHEEQMTVWSDDIAGRLSMGNYLRDDLSYDDVVSLRAEVADEIRSIVKSAFSHPELAAAPAAPVQGGGGLSPAACEQVMKEHGDA
jgi:hypothetical protein